LVKGTRLAPSSFSGRQADDAAMAPGYFSARCLRRAALAHRGDGIIGAQHPRGVKGALLPQAWPHTATGVTPALARAR